MPTADTTLDEIMPKLKSLFIDYGNYLVIGGTIELDDLLDEAKQAIENLITLHTQKAEKKAKYSIIINTLKLINTEPIHTVEHALLFDKERLKAYPTNPTEGSNK